MIVGRRALPDAAKSVSRPGPSVPGTRGIPTDTFARARLAGTRRSRPRRAQLVFNRKHAQAAQLEDAQHADLVDLFLAADETTRAHLMLQIMEDGVMKRSEADALMAHVLRLERVAGPRSLRPAVRSDTEALVAWGIDYP